ncbi:MAG: bifunctional riboflavin kinase/FAD synthetase [Clostridia bacterium]|nr:bifunctional riboflavin kinase/FAD synthetase [Clostridia bacterium]
MTDGFIILDKPEGVSSFGLLKKLKRHLRGYKVGHTGTLDPMATGVLCVALGKATGFINFLPKERKIYLADFKLGIRTDTRDITGQIIEKKDVKSIDFTRLLESAKDFEGKGFQIPPMFSAVSVDGQKLYKLARQGKEIKRKERPIEIYSFEIEKIDDLNYRAKVICSPGTYIRTLIDDLGEKIGTYATLTALRRLESDGFSIKQAVKIEDIDNIDKHIISVDECIKIEKKLKLNKKQGEKFLNGNRFSLMEENGIYAVYDEAFIGVGKIEKNILKPMKIFEQTKKNVLALGNFDGVHQGHKDVMNTAIELSKELNANPVAVYFKEHPAQVLGTKDFFVLTEDKDKAQIIKSLGLLVKRLDFNMIKDFTPEEFFDKILINKFNATGIVCGENYTFGKGKSGDTKLLKKLCKKNDLSLKVLKLDEYNNEPISSTRIKKDLSLGNIKSANYMLGRPFSYDLEVVKGNGIGDKQLGYPTINQHFPKTFFVPKNGVYKSYVEIDGKRYNAVTNIGTHPTVKAGKRRSETHILDFTGNLYGKKIRVFLVDFLRDEMMFENLSMLKEQIKKDIEKANSKI